MGAEIEVMGAGAEEDVEKSRSRSSGRAWKRNRMRFLSLREIILKFRMCCRKSWMRRIPLDLLLDSVIDRDIAVSEDRNGQLPRGKRTGRIRGDTYRWGGIDWDRFPCERLVHCNGEKQWICDGMGRLRHQIRSIVYCNSSYEKAYELTKDMLNRYPQISLLVRDQ